METPLTLESVSMMRQRLLAGEDVSQEELTAAVAFLRVSRAAAPAAKAAKEPKTTKTKPEIQAILDGLL